MGTRARIFETEHSLCSLHPEARMVANYMFPCFFSLFFKEQQQRVDERQCLDVSDPSLFQCLAHLLLRLRPKPQEFDV